MPPSKSKCRASGFRRVSGPKAVKSRRLAPGAQPAFDNRHQRLTTRELGDLLERQQAADAPVAEVRQVGRPLGEAVEDVRGIQERRPGLALAAQKAEEIDARDDVEI